MLKKFFLILLVCFVVSCTTETPITPHMDMEKLIHKPSPLPVFKKTDFPMQDIKFLFDHKSFSWQKAVLQLEKNRLLYANSIGGQGVQVGANVQATKQNAPQPFLLNPNQPDTFYTKTLTASYVFDPFGRLNALVKQQEKQYEASFYDVQAVYLQMLKEYVRAYQQVAYAVQKKNILQKQMGVSRKNVLLVQHRQLIGKATGRDLLTARQNLQALNGQYLLAKQEITRSFYAYCNILGMQDRSMDVRLFKKFASLPRIKRLLQKHTFSLKILDDRPDVKMAYALIQAADSGGQAAIADLFPNMTLSFSLQNMTIQFADLFDMNNLIKQIGANISQTLWDNNLKNNQIDLQKTEKRLAEVNYLETLTHAFNHVRLSQSVLENTVLLQKNNIKNQTLADQNLALSRFAYGYGKISLLDFLKAEQDQAQAKLQLLESQKLFLDSYVEFITALGIPIMKP